ncbi:PQQ-binding-like beta-propeller repeat protein [Dactylosporangium sp. NPDC050688]|uniref:outer membrane protein assembly factor BamB family protein n=1 Tax=Dactylosporangium sp. NPDC050688 TaxID=3157217 RepID=UPI0033D2BFD6
MARRGAVRNFETALGAIGVLALIITGILVTGWNPIPKVSGDVTDWWEKVASSSGKLSEPQTLWTDRVGGQPSAAVIAGDAVVVQMRGTIEARGLRSGTELWTKEADWAAVAGDEANVVMIVGRRGKGLEALNPSSGTVKWKDGAAVGAWTYRDSVLVLSCDGLTDCALTARAPKDGAQIWKLALPGIGRVLAGANNDLLGTRLLSGTYDDAVEAMPGGIPAMLGFPIDQRVQVVDTLTGKRLRTEEPTTSSRIVVVGGRVLVSTAAPKDGNCRFSLEARDPATGKAVWRKDGYDLRTSSGAGCEQRRDPAGADTVIAATRGDNREVFLSPRDGRELFVGAPGDTLVAADSQYGLIRGADKKTLQVINLTTGKTAWTQQIGEKADVAITRYAVLVNDTGAGTLKAYKPDSGSLRLDAKTTSDVLGVGPDGLMISRGRNLGFLPFS